MTLLDNAHNPQRGFKQARGVWAMALSLIVLLVLLAYWLGGVFEQDPTSRPATSPHFAEPALLHYTAQLTNQALSDKQRLLDAYAYTLGLVDANDSLAKKQWLNSHGDLISRLFEETWLVFLPAADAPPLSTYLSSWLLRPGQAAVAMPLTGSVANKFSDILAHKLTASIEISYVVEQGMTRVVHASPALNKQGVPVAVLVALTPLTGYLSLDGLGCLNSTNYQYPLPMPSDRAVLGPFITNAHKQLLATSAGQSVHQLQTLLNGSEPQWQPASQPWSHTDYALQWQRIPGTSWQMGLAIAQPEPVASESLNWCHAVEDEELDWTLPALGLALAVGLLAWLAYGPQGRKSGDGYAAASSAPQSRSATPWEPLESAATGQHASLPLGSTALVLGYQAPDSQSQRSTPLTGTDHPLLNLSMEQLKHSRQCLVLLHQCKIQAISQGAMEFLQLGQTQPVPRAIQNLLAQPQDYERLRILIGAAGQDGLPFSCTVEIVDGLDFHHVVYAKAYPPSFDTPHQRLVVFEADQARLARLCPASLLPQTAPQRDPTSLLPTFDYWRALLQGLLRLSELQLERQSGVVWPEPVPPGYVLYLAIDGFASLSSAGGNAFSDEALRYTANALTHTLSQLPLRHVLGHIHQEQFALACVGLDAQQARHLAKQLQHTIAHLQASFQGTPMLLSISVGLAELPQQLNALDTQLNAADLACFDAASKGIEGLEIAKPSNTAMV